MMNQVSGTVGLKTFELSGIALQQLTLTRIREEEMLGTNDLELLADQFFSDGSYTVNGPYTGAISYSGMKAYLHSFEFKGEKFAAGWRTRKSLSYTDKDKYSEIKYADRVHRWGFGSDVPADVKSSLLYRPELEKLCRFWSIEGDPWARDDQEAMNSFIALMSMDEFKIAKVSKLICFLNQDRYAIYDSRVSYALRKLSIGGLRVFPQVGGRPARKGEPRRVGPTQSVTGDARRIARTYVDFLMLMRCFAERLNDKAPLTADAEDGPSLWNPSLVEMALFMLGESRAAGDKLPRICSYRTRPW